MFEWKDKYSTGIHRIDEQHKGLIEMINKLFAAMQSGAGKDVLDDIFAGLMDYTGQHFLTEELLMSNCSYPELEEHQLLHRKFTEDVLRFEKEYQSGNSGISIQLITFLRNWLDEHICKSDHKYIPYLRGSGLR